MPEPTAERALDDLAAQIHACISDRVGRLSWLRICAPPEDREEIANHLDELLTEMGLDFVDVQIDPASGAPRIAEARFDEGWA